MTGYTRADTADNIANGKAASADDLDAEFNAIQTAFNASTGHTHDGTSGSGAPVTKVGPTQDVVIGATTVLPKTDNTVDLGSSSFEFKDLWIDGTANIDSLVADTADINAGTIDNTVIGATTAAAGSFTTVAASGGVTANVTGNITSAGTSTFATVDINGGAIDATTIGATTAAAATFTTVSATSVTAALTSSSVTFTGGTINSTSIGATTPSTGSFTTLAASGGITGNLTGNVTGALTGNASTATKLATARDIALSGDVVGSVSFDGSANATITTAIQANSVALGTDTTGDYVAGIGGTTNQITVTSSGGEGSTPTLSLPSAVILPGSLQITSDLIVGGNLTVNGTTTTVNSNTVNIGDNTIVLNADETGTPSQDAGIEIERGTSTNVSWLWDETNDRWTAGTQSIYAGGGFTGNLIGDVTGTASNATTAVTITGLTSSVTELNYVDGVTSSIQDQLNTKQTVDATLTSLAALNATAGLVTQTDVDTFTKRTIVGTTNQVTIVDGDGVAGNPTVSAVIPSQAEAEAGTDNTKLMTALRTAQAVSSMAGGANIVAFTASGTYTPTTGYKSAIIIATGGGEAGTNAGSSQNTAGGAAGATVFAFTSLVSLGAQSVTIGAGGTPSGGNGGTTSVGSIASASGGGATYATTGTLGIKGAAGGPASSGANCGGASFWGGGAPAPVSQSNTSVAAIVYGAGGSGASTSSGTSADGGAGMAGVVLILEFK